MYANVRYARIYNMYFKVEPHRATAPPLQLCTCFLWLLFPEVLASYTSKTIVNLSVHRQTYRNKQSIHISSPLYTLVGGCCWSHGQKDYVKVVICFVGAASQSCHLEKLGLRKYIHITCPHYVWHQNHFKLYTVCQSIAPWLLQHFVHQ